MLRARPIAAGSIPERQRLVFMREPPAFSGWLLIFLYAGVGATLGPADGWGWIGLSSAVALLRVLVAVRALAPLPSARSRSMWSALFVVTHIGQALLWIRPGEDQA